MPRPKQVEQQLDFLGPVSSPLHRPLRHRSPSRERSGMVRSHDHDTSNLAADKVASTSEILRAKVLQAFKDHGPMTDGELQKLFPEPEYAYSSAMKRRSELYHADPPKIRKTGLRRPHPDRPSSTMAVWEAVPE